MSERQLEVFSNALKVGVLHEQDNLWSFQYDPGWLTHPDGFDLSPALPRQSAPHRDGASVRTVQWFFDNLLPEEALREALAREARLPGEDAFALLAHFGAESAGSLILRPPGAPTSGDRGWRELPLPALAERIRRLPHTSLSQEAPKRMSLAGAQHKLLVVYRDGALLEPLPEEVSTHILKPDHPDDDYTASVINEYFTMTLAGLVGLPVPPVTRLYTPAPVYLVERFDRQVVEPGTGRIARRACIDSCQLLNKSRLFKYQAATIDTLNAAIHLCRNRAKARLQLYQWLVFNALVGNHDNHLKNISFLVSAQGIDIAPCYDLLSTAVYTTRAFAQERATWPDVELAIPLPGATHFGQVGRHSLLAAGEQLGLARSTAQRELDRLLRQLPEQAHSLLARLESHPVPPAAQAYRAGEMRLLRTLVHLVMANMVGQVASA